MDYSVLRMESFPTIRDETLRLTTGNGEDFISALSCKLFHRETHNSGSSELLCRTQGRSFSCYLEEKIFFILNTLLQSRFLWEKVFRKTSTNLKNMRIMEGLRDILTEVR